MCVQIKGKRDDAVGRSEGRFGENICAFFNLITPKYADR